MTRFAKLLTIAVALAVPAVAAHADPITGSIGINGNDTYTSDSITFVAPDNATTASGTLDVLLGGSGAIGSTANGDVNINMCFSGCNADTFTFTSIPVGGVGLFSAADGISFTVTSVSSYGICTDPSQCTVGNLAVDGTGFFTENGYSNTSGTFELGSGTEGSSIVFQSALAATPTPEPSSLLLLGTGLLGSAGLLYRRSRASVS